MSTGIIGQTQSLPLVSVLMITYNHEKYIEQAIQGALDQKTNFPFEIIIGDDASTDATQGICKSYQKRYGEEKIKLILSQENRGAKNNLVRTLGLCSGKYVAICEGDDYWDDHGKLQEQCDFLERNPSFVMVGGYAKQVFESEGYKIIRDNKPSIDDCIVDTSFLISNNPFSTLTVFFRNMLIKEFPEVYFLGRGGDRRLYLLLSEFGPIKYINRAWGVYRVHSKGISPKSSDPFNKQVETLFERIAITKAWNKYFKFRFQYESTAAIKVLEGRLFMKCIERMRIDIIIRYFLFSRYRD